MKRSRVLLIVAMPEVNICQSDLVQLWRESRGTLRVVETRWVSAVASDACWYSSLSSAHSPVLLNDSRVVLALQVIHRLWHQLKIKQTVTKEVVQRSPRIVLLVSQLEVLLVLAQRELLPLLDVGRADVLEVRGVLSLADPVCNDAEGGDALDALDGEVRLVGKDAGEVVG